MKTSALFQNTISSFFLKRARTVKYCAVFAVYVLCAIGAWGTEYTWTDRVTDSNWKNVNNWGGSGYPGTGDTAIFTGNTEVTVVLDADITISTIKTGTGGASKVTINTNGYSLTTTNFTVNAGATGSYNTTTVITGNGTLTVSGTATVSSGAEMNVNAANFSGTVTNNGTITCGDGAITFGETTNSGGITCSTTTTVFNDAVTVSAGGMITGTEGIAEFKSTVTNSGTITGGSGAVTFGGNVTNDGEISGSSGTITFSGTTDNSGTITASDGAVTFGETTNSGGITCSTTTTVFNDAVTVSAGGMITGTEGTAEFKSTVTNSGTITGGSGAVTFGGTVTNDGKITASNGAVTFNGSVMNNGEISGSSGTITFSGTYGSSTNATAKLTASSGSTYFYSDANFSYTTFAANNGTALFNSATGQTLTTNGQTFNNVTLPDTGTTSLLTVKGTLNINGKLTTGANRTLDMQTKNSALNVVGITDNSGEIKLGSQPAQFTGAVTNSGKITASDGAVTFGGNVTNDGEISGSFGELTFSGTYRSSTNATAKLTASSGNTYFSSNADFSYTTFTANGGTVLFNSTATTGQKLTLKNNTVSFNEITIQTSAGGFTAEGTETGNLSAKKLTLASTNAGAVFNVPVTAETIENTGGSFNITFNAATTVTTPVTFGTTGMLTLGNDTTDTLTFAGGITHTQGNTTLCGKIITNSAEVTLSDNTNIKTLTLTGNSAVQTTGADGTGSGAAITLGSVSGMGKALTLTGGTGNITVYGAVGAESAKLGNISITGNAVTLQKPAVTQGTFTVTNSGSLIIAEAADISADGGFTQDGTGTLAIGGISAATEITTKNAPISFNGSGRLTLNGDILLISSSDTANGGDITIKTPVEPAGNPAPSLTLSAGKGKINFNSDTGTTNRIKDVSVQSASEVEFTEILKANKISVTAEKITLTQNAQLDTAETAVFSNSGILLLKPGRSINSAGTIEQNGIGENQIAGKITAKKITLKTNTYIYNETEIKAEKFTVGSDTTPADLYISALEGGISARVTFNANVSIHGNYALFNGNVTQNENLSVEKDIILLNGNADAMYKDANDGTSSSGVEDLFKYTRPNSSVIAKNSLSRFPDAMPDGTAINHKGEYSSTFSGFSGKTISAGQNFYDNGTALSPDGSWTLKLKANDKATDAFAELYNAEIAYCTVTATTSGTAWLSAAENCTDGGNNDGVFFSRPEILVHNAANAKDTTGNANLSGTYTVYDNVIRVEFADSITKQPLKIENSCNEISAALSHIEFGGTAQKIFEGAYTTAECTQCTDGKGDLSVFFLKTADSDKWNTDATGISQGADESTDWNGTHRTAIPYLNIPKALDSVWQTLRDEHKNRIAHYYTQTPLLSSENGTSGATFTAVPDLCAPVLVAVRTGQELHVKNDGTAESQLPYDSHNFIELQYSEPVNTGSILLTSTEEETVQNTQATSDFGKIEGNSGNGITVYGLIKTASGMLKTGSNGTEDNLVHSLYRKFSVTAGAEASFNTHRLRISIAGYVDKTVSTARGSFKHWKGYIDSAKTPSGTVTRLFSPLITDYYGNTIDAAGTDAHKLPDLSVISEESGLYGKWDTLAPVFAAYKNITNDEDTGFEAVATCSVDGTTLDRIEFHVFDNGTNDNETNEPDWYIMTGWCNSSKALFTPFSYAADIFGGARPFSADEKVRTSGGLRYASLYDKSSSFSYKIDGGNPASFSPDEITGGAKGLVFRTQSDVTNATGGEDGLYFALYLSDSSIPLKTTFEVTYNENGFVTDLAGNRMKTETITTIDRTPPAFNMSIGAVPDDSGNSYEELYVIFNKNLNTSTVTVYNNDGTMETKQFSEALRESLRFIDSSTKSPAQDISISTEKEVTVVFQNEYFTGLKIPLNRSLTYDDIKSLWIQAYTEKTSVDPLSGVKNANVTYIQDTLGNYLPYKSAHAISDFAVNIVNPIYAYDTRMTEDGTFFSQLMMHQDGSWAVHDWNAEQKNYGTLSAGYDLFIEANLSDGSGEAPEDTTVFAYFDTMPDTQALSVTYNENISGTSLSSWRIWLPNYITDSSGTQESPVFKALSPQNNTMSKQTVLSGIKGEVPADAKTTGEIQFSLNTTTMENAGWKSGDQISFLFALSDGSNNPVKICHAPEYDSLTDTYTTEESPLFALRLKNIGDISSADLWSFKLQSITKQRGGVTIFNNVINASKGEKTVVQVNMPSGGTLNVIVMTLDGNIVKYLQHGETSQGNHNYTWDGTTKSGKKVARGLYFIRVFGNGIDETRKVMVVK